MIDRITAGAASLMGTLTFATAVVRWAVTRPATPGRHRAQPRLVTLDELLGEPSAYTSYSTLTDVEPAGVVRTGFGWCERCANTMPGTINRDGFLCGHCLTPAGGVS